MYFLTNREGEKAQTTQLIEKLLPCLDQRSFPTGASYLESGILSLTTGELGQASNTPTPYSFLLSPDQKSDLSIFPKNKIPRPSSLLWLLCLPALLSLRSVQQRQSR